MTEFDRVRYLVDARFNTCWQNVETIRYLLHRNEQLLADALVIAKQNGFEKEVGPRVRGVSEALEEELVKQLFGKYLEVLDNGFL